MSDIHGRLTAFEKTLTKWNSDTEVLVLLGDYVDRGPDSHGMLKRSYRLSNLFQKTLSI